MIEPANRINVVAATAFDGGAEQYISRLYRGLAASGQQVRLIGSIPPWPRDELSAVDPGFGPKWSLRTIIGGALRLRHERRALSAVTAESDGEIYHLHFKREQVGFSAMLSKRGRVYWTEHGRFPKGLFGLIILPFYRVAARRVVSIACVSEIVADDIRRVLGPRCEIIVIPNAVDTHQLQPVTRAQRAAAQAEFGLPDGPVAVFAGRLEPAKRADLAVEAARMGGFTLLVAGEGSQLEGLKRDNPGGRVKFAGHVNGAQNIFACADVHLFTSNGAGEGFPTVLLEAAAMGVPSVAAEDSGFGQLLVESGGLSVSATPEAIHQAALDLMGDDQKRSLARAWSEQFDVRFWVSAHVRLFQRD